MEGWNFYEQAAAASPGSAAVSAPPPPPDSELAFSDHGSVGPVTVSALSIAAARRTTTAAAAAEAPAPAPSPVRLLGEPSLTGLDPFYVERLRRLYARMHPYQRELFRLSSLQDFIVYLQTGGGKTWVAAALTCYRLAVHRGTRVFFVVRGVALAEQQTAVLQRLVDSPVACIVGGVKQFKTPQLFLLATEYRVAVFIDTILFKWLGECPELIDEGLVSMVMLDEVHHAQAGPYKQICEFLHARRAKEAGEDSDAGWMERGGGGSSAAANARARFEGVGRRSPESVVLACKLRSAVQEEKRLREAWLQRDGGMTAAPAAAGAAAAAAGSGATDGIGVRVSSPVLEAMLRCAPHDVTLPHFGGLSASPVVHFTDTAQELVGLLAVTRCRLVSVVDEAANLQQHLPQPALLALSFLPVFEDRVLQAQLRHVMMRVFRRMEALIKESAARNKLDVLRSASVLSPGFRALCDQFSLGTVMTVRFRSNLRIPRDSELVAMVEAFQANQVLEADERQLHRGGAYDAGSEAATRPSSAGSGTLSSAPTATSRAAWRYVSELKPEEEADVCVDFIQHALTLLQCLSDMLIALEEESRRVMVKKFVEVYTKEELNRMGTSSLAITAVVLRPILKSLFHLMYALERHMKARQMRQAGDGDRGGVDGDGEDEEHEGVMATAARVSRPVAASPSPPAFPPPPPPTAPQSISDAMGRVPPVVRRLSTRTQVLLRLFAELALVAVTMSDREASNGGSGVGGDGEGGDGHLRVLAFVSTRDQATYIMEILRRRSPWVWQVLQPSVLLGQASGKKNAQNYMTRSQQVEVLNHLRAGRTRLVFATSVAEEGIDVPACHVVVRCNPQTELRTIVQCCGRLRMRRTLFVSLSNLFNGHPRLGYVVGAMQDCERMVLGLGRRSRLDAWSLARDDLVDGAEQDGTGTADDGGFGGAAVSLPPNPNEVNRLTPLEQNFVSRRQSILAALQRGYQAEVYCVQRRDIAGSPLEVMEFTLLMSIPVSMAAAAAARTGGHALPPPRHNASGGGAHRGGWGASGVGDAQWSVGAQTAAVRDEAWVRVRGRFTGGVVGAHHKSFVEFLRSAKEQGIVNAEGRLAATPPFTALAVEEYPALQTSGAGTGPGRQAFMPTSPTYATSLTANVVFLGRELCLCRPSTWPPSVLEHFFSARAMVLPTYVHDLWTSRLEPQVLLYEELRDAGVPAAKFTSEAAERRSRGYRGDFEDAEDADADEDGSSTLHRRASSRIRGEGAVGYAMVSDSTGGSSWDSRNWTHKPLPPSTAMTTMLAIAEVRFCAPVRRVEGAEVGGIGDISAVLPTGSSRVTVDEFTKSRIEMRDVVTTQRANDGTRVQAVQREFTIRYRGKYAEQVVSMVALRLLGVYVVHGVDVEELEQKLSRCRRVSSLQDTS